MSDSLTIPALLAETDFPWIIVAMIFIAFFRWISDRMARSRRGVFEDEEEMEYEPYEGGNEDFEPQTPPAPPAPPAPSPSTSPAGSSAQQLRRFLETIADPSTGRAVSTPPPPPPAPALSTAAARPAPKETSVSQRFKDDTAPRRIRRQAAAREGLFVLNPSTLQQAIILKEVLDPPRALQDDF